jgi:hypothetical protein
MSDGALHPEVGGDLVSAEGPRGAVCLRLTRYRTSRFERRSGRFG